MFQRKIFKINTQGREIERILKYGDIYRLNKQDILQGQALFIRVKQKLLFHFWTKDRQTEKTVRQTEDWQTKMTDWKGRKDRQADRNKSHTYTKDRHKGK